MHLIEPPFDGTLNTNSREGRMRMSLKITGNMASTIVYEHETAVFLNNIGVRLLGTYLKSA